LWSLGPTNCRNEIARKKKKTIGSGGRENTHEIGERGKGSKIG